MRIAIGCDHGAFALKNKVIEHLEKQGHEVRDFGTYSTESCDYPDFAAAAARAVASGECQRGIVLCTTGIGVSISANKIDGIRCPCAGSCIHVREDGGGLFCRNADGQFARSKLRTARIIGGIGKLQLRSAARCREKVKRVKKQA